MRILIISPLVPFPPVGGLGLRTHHLLRALSAQHQVTLVGFTYGETPAAAPFPLEVIPVPWRAPKLYAEMRSTDPALSRRAFEILAHEVREPWFASYYACPEMEETLRQVVSRGFDLAWFETTSMGGFASALPAAVPKLLDFPDLHTLVAQRASASRTGEEKRQADAETERVKWFENKLASQCACGLVCSDLEAAAARALLDIARIEVVPNGVDTKFFVPTQARSTHGSLLFVGIMDYPPNAEAVCHFVADIFPEVRRQMPAAVLHVVGARPTAEVLRLASDSVVIHGFVPDVRPYYRAAEVVIVPLLHGGGTRLKILEAAASGRAIVATSMGAEGLALAAGDDIEIADSPAEFAAAVFRLSADEQARQRLSINARRAVLPYDWDAIGAEVCRIVATVS